MNATQELDNAKRIARAVFVTPPRVACLRVARENHPPRSGSQDDATLGAPGSPGAVRPIDGPAAHQPAL